VKISANDILVIADGFKTSVRIHPCWWEDKNAALLWFYRVIQTVKDCLSSFLHIVQVKE
jgi:hypothetical protein